MKFGFLFPPLGDPIFVGAEAEEGFLFPLCRTIHIVKKWVGIRAIPVHFFEFFNKGPESV